jgi:hypothetical protein
MNTNRNKTVHVTAEGITICYTDTNKHEFIPFETHTVLNNLQLYGNSYKGRKFQRYERDEFTPAQTHLYKDAIFGLSHYTAQERARLTLTERFKIQQLNQTTQKVLNKWKQQLLNSAVDDLLSNLFFHSTAVKAMVEKTHNATDKKMVNHHTFAELGINKRMIAEKLVNCKVLPDTFFLTRKAA